MTAKVLMNLLSMGEGRKSKINDKLHSHLENFKTLYVNHCMIRLFLKIFLLFIYVYMSIPAGVRRTEGC